MTTGPAVLKVSETTYSSSGEFETFFAAQRVSAVRLAYLLCGDAGAAEELAADAFAKMYAAWQRADLVNPEAYLRRSLVNAARSRGRRRALERRELMRRTVRAYEALLADQAADRQLLVVALSRLPLHQRAPIVLRFFEDLSERDTAAVLGKDIGTVKSSVSRGLKRLREILETKEWEQ